MDFENKQHQRVYEEVKKDPEADTEDMCGIVHDLRSDRAKCDGEIQKQSP